MRAAYFVEVSQHVLEFLASRPVTFAIVGKQDYHVVGLAAQSVELGVLLDSLDARYIHEGLAMSC